IRVSPFGYGKAIYLKLDTGEIAVYAHLSGFNEALSEFVYNEQQKRNKYRLDRYLSAAAFPVKKGDFLGYTGETGIGVPHLHFEMRDVKNRPINPFLRGYNIDDVQAPTIKSIAFIPLAFDTRINDDFIIHIDGLRKIDRTHYQLTNPVNFEGEMGIAVRTFDQSGTVRNVFGIYRISLFIDGQHYYTSQFDKFSYANNRFMELDREYRLVRQGKGKYYRLFLDPENRLSFYKYRGAEKGRLIYDANQSGPIVSPVENFSTDSLLSILTNGKIKHPSSEKAYLSQGKHALTIFVQDFFGNTSMISGTLLAGKKVELKPQYKVTDNDVFLESVDGLHQMVNPVFRIWQQSPGQENRWQLFNELAVGHTDDMGTNHAFAPVHLFEKQAIFKEQKFRFAAEDKFGLLSWPSFLPLAQKESAPKTTIRIEADFYDQWARFKFTTSNPLRKKPLVEVTSGDRSTAYPLPIQSGVSEYLLPVQFDDFNGANVRILMSGESSAGEIVSADTTFDNFHIAKNQAASFSSPDGMIEVIFNKSSLYRDLYGRARFHKQRDQRDNDAISDEYITEPQDVPLNRGATIRMKYPKDVVDPSKLGLYYETRRGWSFINNDIDTVNHVVSAKVFSLEKFAVRKDDSPPEIKVYRPGEGQYLGEKPQFKVLAKDENSGFASEESLLMKIDGKKAIAEYDPETGILRYKPRQPLTQGKHEFSFRAVDRSGNERQINRSFYVN
ncbi:MAG: M23 family peptidase, partial [Calditrichaeota bacterium]